MIYDSARKISPLTNSPKYWGIMKKHLQEELDLCKDLLVTQKNSDEIRITQGKALAFKQMLNLRDNVAAALTAGSNSDKEYTDGE